MASLSTKVRLYLKANGKTGNELGPPHDSDTKVYITKDGGVPERIGKWEVDGLAEPTTSQLNALDSDSNTVETNNGVRNIRESAYGKIGDQLDLLYKDLVAGKVDATGEWAKHIKAVKDANSKS